MAAMTAIRHLAATVLLAGSLGMGAISAVETTSPPVQVQQWLDSWTSLSGEFRQEVSSPTLPAGQVESGTFQIARPDRMRWDYVEPEPKVAVTDGVSTWLYLPLDRQVIVGRLESLRQDGAVALLLSGSLRLEEAFAVSHAGRRDGRIEMVLIPRSTSASIARIEVQATASGSITSFTVHDPAGNSVLWAFEALRLDPPLQEVEFSFQVPAGVEVQDLDEMGHSSP
jgi:outer membrane lipoprotein carrier protein